MREDHTEPKPDTLKPVFVSIAKVFAGAMVGGAAVSALYQKLVHGSAINRSLTDFIKSPAPWLVGSGGALISGLSTRRRLLSDSEANQTVGGQSR